MFSRSLHRQGYLDRYRGGALVPGSRKPLTDDSDFTQGKDNLTLILEHLTIGTLTQVYLDYSLRKRAIDMH